MSGAIVLYVSGQLELTKHFCTFSCLVELRKLELAKHFRTFSCLVENSMHS